MIFIRVHKQKYLFLHEDALPNLFKLMSKRYLYISEGVPHIHVCYLWTFATTSTCPSQNTRTKCVFNLGRKITTVGEIAICRIMPIRM